MCGGTREGRTTPPTRATRGRRPPPFLVAAVTGPPRSTQARLPYPGRGHYAPRRVRPPVDRKCPVSPFTSYRTAGRGRSTERRPIETTVGSPPSVKSWASAGARHRRPATRHHSPAHLGRRRSVPSCGRGRPGMEALYSSTNHAPYARRGGTMTPSIDPPMQSPPTSGATNVTGTTSTTDVAKDEARNVGQTAAQAVSQVASTAADQAKQVTQETKRQAQD